MNCELCNMAQKTHWHHEDENWIIADCITCNIPMLVYKDHSMKIPVDHLADALQICKHLFGSNISLRTNQRKIYDHWHVHVENTLIMRI